MIGTSELGRALTEEWNSPGVRYANYFVRWHYVDDIREIVSVKGRQAFVNRKAVIKHKRR